MLGGLVSNLRIIYANLADQAVLSASSTAGSLGVVNLRTERKGEPHRSVGTSVTFTLTWSAAQVLSGVAIPACNLTPDATIRVQAWDAEAGGVQLLDTGVVDACPGQMATAADWGHPVTAALFSFGAASKVATWFAESPGVRRLQIDLADPGNPAGFIDCSRLVVGKSWSPMWGASRGLTYSTDDQADVSRSDAGSAIVDRGPVKEQLNLSLDTLLPDDRAELDRIVRLVGSRRPILVAMALAVSDAPLDHSTLIYGYRKSAPMTVAGGLVYRHVLTLEGW